MTRGRQLWESADAGEYLQVEQATEARKQFEELDDVLKKLVKVSLRGRQAVKARRKTRTGNQPGLYFPELGKQERELIEEYFMPVNQEARGQWALPEAWTASCGPANLTFHHAEAPEAMLTLAMDDRTRVEMTIQARDEGQTRGHDATICLWALLPFYEQLAAPLFLRSAPRLRPAGAKKLADQQERWQEAEAFYSQLGVDQTLIEPFLPGNGFASLSRDQVIELRGKLLDGWEEISLRAADYWRAISVGELVDRFYKRAAKGGAPTRKQVMKKALEPTLTLWFGGDWVAFLDYLGEEPAPQEELVTSLPETSLVGAPSADDSQVAEIDQQEIELILSSYWGQAGGNPARQRVEALSGLWERAEQVYLKLDIADDNGLSDQVVEQLGGAWWSNPRFPDKHAIPLESLLGPDLADTIERLWGTSTPERYTGRLVTERYPLRAAVEVLGDAWVYWHGKVAWLYSAMCEDTVSVNQLKRVFSGGGHEEKQLERAGFPIPEEFFGQAQAEIESLDDFEPPKGLLGLVVKSIGGGGGPGVSISIGDPHEDDDDTYVDPKSLGRLLQILLNARAQWAQDNLAGWLEYRWTKQLSEAADQYQRQLARRGKPPTNTQLFKLGEEPARWWFGGSIDGVCGALAVPSPGQEPYERLLPGDVDAFERRLFTRLGGHPYNSDDTDKENDRQSEISGLVDTSVRLLRQTEALGERPPMDKYFARSGHQPLDPDPEVAWDKLWAMIEEER